MTRKVSTLIDGVFLGALILLACAGIAIVTQNATTMHIVRTAATTPIAIARDAMGGSAAQQYVARTEWVRVDDLVSLRVYPTEAGRQESAGLFDADVAWAQVLTLTPDADTPGMREQFVCHWRFAELVRPGKASWNLEPWRPVVNGATMIQSRCNPGAAEESF